MRRVLTAYGCGVAMLACTMVGCTAEEPVGTARPSESPASGPLEAYLAAATGETAGDGDARADEDVAREQEIIAECMTAKGFEYTPFDYHASVYTFDYAAAGVDPDSREFAEEYGYGIVRFPVDPEAEAADEEIAQLGVDPVRKAELTMSESGYAAFVEALRGERSADPMDDAGVIRDWQERGCAGLAAHEVYGERDAVQDQCAALAEEVREVLWSIEDSARVLDVEAEWAACMAEAGHEGLTRRAVASIPLSQEYIELLTGVEAPDTSSGGPEQREDPVAELMVTPEPSFVPDQAAIDKLHDREVAQAVADWNCVAEVDYRARVARISAEIQQEFVDQRQGELDAWVQQSERAAGTGSD